MLKELGKTVKAQLYERVSSPLLASFALSWAAWNYKFLLVMISSETSAQKFELLEKHVFPNSLTFWLNGITFPLFTALALIFIYPIPARYIFRYTRNQQKKLKEIRQEIDDKTPVSNEEARELRADNYQKTIELEGEREKLRAEIVRRKNATDENEKLLGEISMLNGRLGELDVQKIEIFRLSEKIKSLENYSHTQQAYALALESLLPEEQLKNAARLKILNKLSENKTVPENNSPLNTERILVTGEQYILESIKQFLMTEPSFEGEKFTIDAHDSRLSIQLMPKGLLGNTKIFEYPFQIGADGAASKEVARLKPLILEDIRIHADKT